MRRALLPLLLLLAACGYDVPRREVTLGVGLTDTVNIQALRWFAGSMVPIGAKFVSSDPSIFLLHQAGTGPSMVVEGVRPGVAYIMPADMTTQLVTVTVLPCLPITLEPTMAQVLATIGQQVDHSRSIRRVHRVTRRHDVRGEIALQHIGTRACP